ncbi:MAG: sensor protein, partial [Gemmatimonadetes bacterium]|nr:sensor protein [Gemmatimonadota bacterium]
MEGGQGTTEQTATEAARAPAWSLPVAASLFAGWILFARVGPLLALEPGVRAWYPPVALLAAACILWGARALIPIVLAAWTLGLAFPTSDYPFWRLLIVSPLLKVAYWGAARVLRRCGFEPDFSNPVDVPRFGVTMLVAGLLAALLGVADARNFESPFVPEGIHALRTFWAGDLVAVVALTPALLAAASWMARWRRGALSLSTVAAALTRRALFQLACIPVALVAATLLAPELGFFAYALCFLPLAWIALEHGPRIAALANLVLTIGAVTSIPAAVVPRSLEVQTFMVLLALTGLLIGSVADQREHAHRLLHESEERYRLLVDLLPDPLVVHTEGRILFANGAASTLLRAESSESLIGMLLSDLAAPSSRALVRERLETLDRGEGVPLVHHAMQRIDGSGNVDIEAVSIPIRFEGREAALTVARDVTTRMRLETELRHAQRMEAVGRLAGGIAHDFNNLLTVITSYSELILADAATGAHLASDVREILQASDRAATMTRQLLSFSRRQLL